LPEVSFEKKSGQNFDFNPVKFAPKVKRANITACITYYEVKC